MVRKQSLRVLDSSEVLQSIVEEQARLFAQFALADSRKHRVSKSELIDDQNKERPKIFLGQ